MKDYMAPMEGITTHIFRYAYHAYFHPMDKYFTPFISAKPNKQFNAKEIREVSPETNKGLRVIPQILANHAEDFLHTARILKEYGHTEINLNLGCPSGTVTAKGKGSGFLKDPEELDRFLDQITEGLAKDNMQLSIKTRIGISDDEDWEELMEVYNRYPITELIVHPRIQKDYYKGALHLDAFEKAVDQVKAPLCYNGDLFSSEAFQTVTNRFPSVDTFMYGRGLISNPGLIGEIRDGTAPDKVVFRKFHDKIYSDYKELLHDERNVLFRMKELWSYLAVSFCDSGKYAKKIKKAQHYGDYEAAVAGIFSCFLRC